MQFDGQCFNFIEFEHIDYKATLKPLVFLKKPLEYLSKYWVFYPLHVYNKWYNYKNFI